MEAKTNLTLTGWTPVNGKFTARELDKLRAKRNRRNKLARVARRKNRG